VRQTNGFLSCSVPETPSINGDTNIKRGKNCIVISSPRLRIGAEGNINATCWSPQRVARVHPLLATSRNNALTIQLYFTVAGASWVDAMCYQSVGCEFEI
jgi:hypothetical protein